MGDADYLAAWQLLLGPIASAFAPDLVRRPSDDPLPLFVVLMPHIGAPSTVAWLPSPPTQPSS